MTCSVLIIEDDDDLREALVEGLGDQGFRAVATDDGNEALAMLRDGLQPAVIVLDLLMPLMDGITFLRHQDVEPALRSIPVIVLSADRHHHPFDLTERAFAVLTKPVPLDQLSSVVREGCAESGRR